MRVSRYDDEPAGQWAVDAAFRGNGMPLWSNGTGARYLRVRLLDRGMVTDELDALAADRIEHGA
jgi:hypothetical protein